MGLRRPEPNRRRSRATSQTSTRSGHNSTPPQNGVANFRSQSDTATPGGHAYCPRRTFCGLRSCTCLARIAGRLSLAEGGTRWLARARKRRQVDDIGPARARSEAVVSRTTARRLPCHGLRSLAGSAGRLHRPDDAQAGSREAPAVAALLLSSDLRLLVRHARASGGWLLLTRGAIVRPGRTGGGSASCARTWSLQLKTGARVHHRCAASVDYRDDLL
jgi:hypothetical protein